MASFSDIKREFGIKEEMPKDTKKEIVKTIVSGPKSMKDKFSFKGKVVVKDITKKMPRATVHISSHKSEYGPIFFH